MATVILSVVLPSERSLREFFRALSKKCPGSSTWLSYEPTRPFDHFKLFISLNPFLITSDIENCLHDAIRRQIFPGGIIGIIKNGEKLVIPAGNFTYDPASPKIQESSIFDIASITKSIPTSSIILKLIEQGQASLDDQAIKYLPEINNKYREEILLRHLLTFTVILNLQAPLSSHKNKSADEVLSFIFNSELIVKPGKKFYYTNAPSILLGLIAEKITGKSLGKLAEEMFFFPLGMNSTTFHPEQLNQGFIVPTEHDNWRGKLIQGVVHDETAYTLKKNFISGNAGLFSTANDLLTFLGMLLNEGLYNNQRYFSKATIQSLQTNQLSPIGESASLGWELNQPRFMGQHSTPNTFGKTGFTGCSVVCDISRQVGFVILSNTIYPKRKSNASLINQFRSEIADIIF